MATIGKPQTECTKYDQHFKLLLTTLPNPDLWDQACSLALHYPPFPSLKSSYQQVFIASSDL